MIGTWRVLNARIKQKFPLPGTEQFKVIGNDTPRWFVCACYDLFGTHLGDQVLSGTYIEYNTGAAR